ncbi:trypsin-like peptidase domain-containing protein [Acetivibrio cellulolyticus]|uniref:trypsin-like peptidase domain-containing protein n=1 Tax=Acetivibrio cellulolyticus TaxID=35830 RepID=UPI0001E2DEC0|nr:trypsin-like peptidase domain-containing protein [Acetivibrio cellulolyticus]
MSLKKKLLIVISVSSLLIFSGCTGNTQEMAVEPVLLDNTILRPDFYLHGTDFEAGTAFAVEIPEKNASMVLTALHLFGPDGGLEEEIPSSELADNIQKVTFSDAFTGEACGECVEVLSIPDAEVSSGVDKDIAAFYYGDDMKVPKLKISSKLPKKGETIWLAASVMTAPEDKKLHKATVRSASKKMLTFEYEDEGIMITATSGAPILNSKGEVVGINIGGYEDGKTVTGCANPCTSFKEMIMDALK